MAARPIFDPFRGAFATVGAFVGLVEVAVKLSFAFSCGVLVLASAGCATATGSDEGGDAAPASKDGGASKDSGAPKKDAAAPSEDSGTIQPTDDAGNTIDDNTCSNQTTKSQCEQCCLTVHPSGYKIYQAQLDDCVCNSPAACATECANEVCANQPTTPNDACATCITNALSSTGACYQAVANACQADSDCTTLFGTCIPPCEQKQ